MKKIILICIFTLGFASSALALEVPKEGKFDPRVRQINYNPKQVTLINGHIGFTTHIQFADYEEITDVAMGDPSAWAVNVKKNNLFLKPATAQEANTNMSVLTNTRTYLFDLKAYNASDKATPQFYMIAFNYPDDKKNADADKLAEQSEKAKRQAVLDKLKASNSPDFEKDKANFNYWIVGTPEVSPFQIYDNGVFTYLTFPPNMAVPALYSENTDKTESLINTHVQDVSTIVVQGVYKNIILRRGSLVAKITNNSFSVGDVRNDTGTTVNGVKRVVKEVTNAIK